MFWAFAGVRQQLLALIFLSTRCALYRAKKCGVKGVMVNAWFIFAWHDAAKHVQGEHFVKVFTLIIGVMLGGVAAGSAAVAEQWQEPERGTQTRRDLMDAIRPIAEWQLGAPVQFVVHELRQVGDLAFGTLGVQRPGGDWIDLSTAPASLRGDISPDDMDGAIYTVLYKKSGDMWVAVEWSIGATDAWWAWEPTCQAFGPVIEEFCVGMN